MSWHTRLFEFPGGLLEINSYGDQADGSGVYLEHIGRRDECDRGEERQGEGMRYRPTCLGYLRTDVSGVGQLWDQAQIRKVAERLGYDFADMVVYDPRFGRPPLARLRAQVTRLAAEAVVVPSVEHFVGGVIPGELVRRVDVVTVSPEGVTSGR
ncbi:hypothetical protein [Nocardia acididurans]|nr:hypothetical protein [Nocardia acididurans]